MIYSRQMMEFKDYMDRRDMSKYLSQSLQQGMAMPSPQVVNAAPQLQVYAQQQAAMLGQGFGSLVANQQEMNQVFRSGFGAVSQGMGK